MDKAQKTAEVTETHQLAWGLKAAKDWLAAEGFMIISAPSKGARIPTIIGIRDSTEIMLEVITQAMIFTSGAREEMHRASEWKNAAAAGRSSVVFVPKGYGQSAKEVLGLYDLCVEFDVL